MIKKISWSIFSIVMLIVVVTISSIAPIDDRPLDEIEAVQHTLNTFKQNRLVNVKGDSTLLIGWATSNITPREPINMAGYGPRGPYKSVLDSLFSRCVVIDNGAKEVVIISLDLLMFPRLVKQRIQDELLKQGFFEDEIFLSATHTHNGFGNWEQSIAGEFIFGSYNEKNVDFLIRELVAGVNFARADKSPAQIGFSKIDAHDLVVNRLAPVNGKKDPYLRLIHMKKATGDKGLMVSFSGHAVNMDADVWTISRDYPGVLVDNLEKNDDIDFALFCAGMVGSHNIDINLNKGSERIMKIGALLSQKILTEADSVNYSTNTTLGGVDLPIDLPPSQLRLTDNLRIRNWIFSKLLGPLQANVKVLGIGDLLLVGMPCDYSGELAVNNQLDQLAEAHGKNLFITSFNGNYVGYITEDAHYYSCVHDEVRSLNWVGPNKGSYFTNIIKLIINRAE